LKKTSPGITYWYTKILKSACKEKIMTTMKFDAEIGKVLHLMIHSLYTNKDIFLRELISNAADACDKLRYLSLTQPELSHSDTNFKITISVDEQNSMLIIKDNGIGMSRAELIENLGTIARSGTQSFVEKLTGDSKKDTQLIGQFGVGFYSAFMVADEISVISNKAGNSEAHIWKSKGEGEFSITETTDVVERGTSIILHLKDSAKEYLDKFRISHIVSTYAEHISVPIFFQEASGNNELLNKATAIWTRPKSEISPEQYKEFFKDIAHVPDAPWLTMHNHNEGGVEYTNLIFIPARKPFDLFHPDRKARIKLYVKKVFIAEDGIDLIPSWLRFLRGIVDSQDLPLNISRETLQHNQVIAKIKKSIIKRVLSELKKKLTSEREHYDNFWENFGSVLKEGLCEGMENRENLLEICLFKSAISGKMITLDEYIAGMKENQTEIFYYLNEEDSLVAANNPQLEGFLKNGLDVLLFNDKVDDFWVNVEHQYKDKTLKSVTRAGIEIDKKDAPAAAASDNVLAYFSKTLGDLVKEVKASYKLVDSPVCLSVAEGAMDIKMERFLLEQKQLASTSAKILEVNLNHPIIMNISVKLEVNPDDADCAQLVNILFDQACIIEGEPIKDRAGFAKRLNKFLQHYAL
jgi:molecular chaperone HtpG